jgi:16S rRNA (adenine1518-N6/adenine1519-N6)-dimethyltransferase
VTLVGNLPYYIASQLLFHFLQQPTPIQHALLMLQKEMAERLTAKPSSSAYGALTLLMQAQYRIEYLRTVSATVFVPQPEVDSAFVRLRLRTASELPPFDRVEFDRIVRAGFSQRRKQLRKMLRDQISDWPKAAAEIDFKEDARAEELSLEQWLALSLRTSTGAASQLQDGTSERFSVVDEKDRPIGEVPRVEVHANNLLHRAVHILVFDDHGRLFLQKRSPWKDRHPGTWDSSAAGHVDAGEEYDQTAARELEEELGLRVPLTRIGRLPASDRTGYEFIQVYRGQANGPFRLNRAEIEMGDFFEPDLVDRWVAARPQDFAPGFLECWKLSRTKENRS